MAWIHRHRCAQACSLALLLLAGATSPALGSPHADGDPPAGRRGAGAGGGGAGAGGLEQEVEAMRRELDRVMQDNREMKSQIDELRALSDEQWLTERRANEIRALVHDVLADADTRASMLQSGLMAGWSEHFFLGSADGRFLLIFEGMEQFRFIFNHHDQPDRWRSGFESARTYLTFRGHVFDEDIEYLIRSDFNRGNGALFLLDGWVRYILSQNWSVRFGQFKMPFDREFGLAEWNALAVDRSSVSEVFGPRRSQGVELQYADASNRWAVAVSDGANRLNSVWSTQDTEWAVSTRYERLLAGSWEQFASLTSPRGDEFGMLLGVGLHAEQGESTGSPTIFRDEVRVLQATADLSMEWGGASLILGGYYFYLDQPNSGFPPFVTFGALSHFFGIVAQAGVYLTPKWEAFIRGEYIFVESDILEIGDLQVVTVGVNYYIDGQDLKWTTDVSVALDEVPGQFAVDSVGFRADAPGAQPQVVVRTQFQLLF